MSEKTKVARCNQCRRDTNHDVLAVSSEEDEEDPLNWFDCYEFLKCRGCGNLSLLHIASRGEGDVIVNSCSPNLGGLPDWLDPTARLLSIANGNAEGVPAKICNIMYEVYEARRSNCLRLCAMGTRAALEMIMIHKVDDHRSFTENIDAFEKAGYLSVRERSIIDSILEAGHAAIHRGWEPTEDDTETLVRVTESVIEKVYLNEPRARRLEKAIPKRQKPKTP